MKGFIRQEKGVVMLEGMVVMIMTLFVLIWILGLGFIYYQRYTTTIVTNDAAVKIASTYNNVNSDIIMGFITSEDLTKRNLYRGYPSDYQKEVNRNRAESYVKYVLNKVNFIGVVKEVHVDLELVVDSMMRRHVELTTTCTYNTPFKEGLAMFGMEGVRTYQVKACADCTDYADYISTVDFGKALRNGELISVSISDKVVGMINKIIAIFDKK